MRVFRRKAPVLLALTPLGTLGFAWLAARAARGWLEAEHLSASTLLGAEEEEFVFSCSVLDVEM